MGIFTTGARAIREGCALASHGQTPTGRFGALRGLLVCTALLLGWAGAAHALTVTVPLRVQDNPDVPYEALNGQRTMLMAVAEGCNVVTWQVDINGDGDWNDADEQVRNATGNNYFVALEYDAQYPNAEGDRMYFPRFRVTGCGETVTATQPVRITVDRLCAGLSANQCGADQNLRLTRRVMAARAVNRGLWYMFKLLTHTTTGNTHLCSVVGGSYPEFVTGHVLNAFLRRGHGHGPRRDTDLYYRNVTHCGVDFILSKGTMANVRQDDVDDLGVNGQGFFLSYGSGYSNSYSASAWIEPIAMFGDPTYVAPIGVGSGRTLHEIGQDMADAITHCQSADGWWHYNCQQTGTDASTNGWPPEALRLLQRKLGVETYDWAKNMQRAKLNQWCNGNGCYYGGWKPSLSGNGLTAYGWTENEHYDPANANVQGLLTAAQGYNFTAAGLYYMYATTKGMRAFSPEITYYPNGTDWNAGFTDFILARLQTSGAFTTDNSYLNYAGDNAETAVAIQIIQSWLEAVAVARAIPQLAGPGIDITFDHAWSYVQDPDVAIDRYCWKVAGDPPAPGQADQVALWDFCTNDRDEKFTYAYDLALDWGEVQRRTATLGVRDTDGRWVFDQDSVEIKLSLLNHKPLIVAHPDGPDAFYRGYLNTNILLDGRASVDIDTQHEVYPGDANRPRGIPDRVTSIAFDLNLDGDYTDPGEDGTNGPVTFIPNENMEFREGELFAVPMRVCDDGQWNGECYDGVTRADCSECTFGSASVQIVINREPPLIDVGTCDRPGGDCEPYVVDDFDGVFVDLSGTIDPEGVLGLRFQYELVEGRGQIVLPEQWRNNAENMGPSFTYLPEPDGPRIDRVRVTAYDFLGLSSEAFVRIVVPNLPPIIDAYTPTFTSLPPVVSGLSVENLGNGRFRVRADAVANPDWLVGAEVAAHDPGADALTYRVDLSGNGVFDINGSDAQPRFGAFRMRGGQNYVANLRVEDDAAAVTGDFNFAVPANAATLNYFFDLGADGLVEVANGSEPQFDFQVAAGTAQVRVSGQVVDSHGNATPFDTVIALANSAPVFEFARSVSQTGFEVLLSARANDADGDTVTYSYDWGDGSAPTVNQGGLGEHAFPEGVYRSYTVRVTAADGRGSSVTRDIVVDFPAPPQNRAPTIDFARVVNKTGFDVLLSVQGTDPDNDPLTWTLTWGDGTETRQQGNLAFHTYPAGVFRGYSVRVRVEDGRGGNASVDVAIDFPPPAANRNPIIGDFRELTRDGFEVIITASAVDPDGDGLTYTLDWGDGSAPSELAAGIGAHVYPAGVFADYQAILTVTDTRGGSVSRNLDVAFDAPPPNQAPVFEFARVLAKDGFNVVISASATDPEGGAVTYSFDWGDGSPVSQVGGGIAEHDFPAGIFDDYDVVITARDPQGGTRQTTVTVRFPRPEDNRAPVFEFSRVLSKQGFNVVFTAAATDADQDPITYTVAWGDGSPETVLFGNLAEHDYPAGEYRAYEIVVRAEDGNGGVAEARVPVVFDAPAPNRAPAFDAARVLSRSGFDVVLSATAYDPDGDALTYTVEWDDASEDTVMRGGVAEHTYPAGVYQAYTARVTVTDGRGGQAVANVQVVFVPPGQNQAPEFEYLGLAEKTGFDVVARMTAVDPDGDTLTYTVTWGDGTPDTAVQGGLADHSYPAGDFRAYTLRATVTDGRGGQASRELAINFPAPAQNGAPIFDTAAILSVVGQTVTVRAAAHDPDGDPVRYRVLWGDGSAEMDLPGGLGEHTWPAGRYGEQTLTFIAIDSQGARTERTITVNLRAPADNQPPVFENLQLLPQGGFDGVLVISARDADGDLLSWTVNWGDGSAPITGRSGLLAHTWPAGAYGTFTVTVTLDDGRGGVAVRTADISFVAPVVNAPPVIDAVAVNVGVRGQTSLVVSAHDPEAVAGANVGPLVYHVHWGTEPDALLRDALINGRGAHTYPLRAQPWAGWVEVIDAHGNRAEQAFAVRVVDAPTTLASFDAEALQGRTLRFVAVATDADGSDDLRYAFDFDGDGIDDLRDQRTGTVVHSYAADGEYTVSVRVTDPWSGASIRRSLTVRVDLTGDPADHQAPLIGDVVQTRGPGGQLDVQVIAWDPQGDPLEITVDFGDGSAPLVLDGSGRGRHVYARAGAALLPGHVTVRDPEGHTAERDVGFDLRDRPTVIARSGVSRLGPSRYLLWVEATDPDAPDGLRYAYDFDGDGQPERVQVLEASAANNYLTPGRVRAIVEVTDPFSGATTPVEIVVDHVRPDPAGNGPPVIDRVEVLAAAQGWTQLFVTATDPDDDALWLYIHWGDEAAADALWPADPQNPAAMASAHRFPAPGAWPGEVVVVDAVGHEVRRPTIFDVVDRPTRVQSFTATPIGDGRVRFAVRATDDDGDDHLRFRFDFDADGTFEVPEGLESLVVHQDAAGHYTAVVEVLDTWSGARTEARVEYDIAPWGDGVVGALPTVHGIDLTVGTRGRVQIAVRASHPQGGRLDYAMHWGDEATALLTEPLTDGNGSHAYAGWGADDGRYAGFVWVTGPDGGVIRAEVPVQLIDAVTVIEPLRLTPLQAGAVLVTVQATDADAAGVADGLVYAFDFDADGIDELSDRPTNELVHSFVDAGQHTVRVGVTDTWSGVRVDVEGSVQVDPWISDPQPPVINALDVQVGAAGRATLTVDAHDPDGSGLELWVHWGDEAEAEAAVRLAGAAGRHTYAYADGATLQGWIEARDADGLTARRDFEAAALDTPTQIRSVAFSSLGGGRVRVEVVATDADVSAAQAAGDAEVSLVYRYDFVSESGDDGLVEFAQRDETFAEYAFIASGDHALRLAITDTWSGTVVEGDYAHTVAPWVEDVPLANDHLEVEEGRCLVFRIADDGSFASKVDADLCERAGNPDEDLWQWDMGDGTVHRGSEIGHRYADDGLYDVVVTGGPAGAPRRSHIQVQVVNVAPEFLTRPRVDTGVGEVYRYVLRVRDPSPADEVRVALVAGDASMVLGRGAEPGEWVLTWNVPDDFALPELDVELRAFDGRLGDDGVWIDDGGETVQRYTLFVEGGGVAPAADAGVDGGEPTGAAGLGTGCNCDVADDAPPAPLALGLLLLGLITRRRRR